MFHSLNKILGILVVGFFYRSHYSLILFSHEKYKSTNYHCRYYSYYTGGYFLYPSIRQIGTNEATYELTSSESVTVDEINSLDESVVEIEVELNGLDELDFQEITTEEGIESMFEDNTNVESDIDLELDELESLAF
jgi:hypothetical protein